MEGFPININYINTLVNVRSSRQDRINSSGNRTHDTREKSRASSGRNGGVVFICKRICQRHCLD